MLCDYVTRGYGEVTVTTTPSRPPRVWKCKGDVLGVVPLLCAYCSEEEARGTLVVVEFQPLPPVLLGFNLFPC